jgi:putative intracellular protease/amidase/coenzyme F420-reducing hydrogenase delta subunit
MRCDSLSIWVGLQKYSGIQLNSYTGEILSESGINILTRFSKVFEQAYIRFADLQKAEAQAKEARVEAALERVRSRSMAMHKTEEIQDVVAVLYDQIKPLGLARDGCELVLCHEETEEMEYWHTNALQSDLPESYSVPKHIDLFFESQWSAWKKASPSITITIEGKEKRKLDTLLFEQTDFRKIPKEVKQWIRSVKKTTFTLVTMKYGLLEAVDVEPLTQEKLSTLSRFAKVFEQSYTRFLDLQKSEAQAREAEIQLAMERVRARSLALHTSEELGEVATLLYDQLKDLGIGDFFNCGYVEVDEENKIQRSWMTRPDGSSVGRATLPLKGDQVLRQRFESWKKQSPVFHQLVSGNRLRQHIAFVSPHFSNREADKIVKSMPDPTIFYCGNFQFGYLHIITGTLLNEEAELILARFTKVFNQAYTRFLDLQKAETQAREAQIGLALERVRSAALAMHHSDELSETIGVLFDQLADLGARPVCTYLVLYDLDRDQFEFRMTGKSGDRLPITMRFSFSELPAFRPAQKAWRAGKEIIETQYLGARRNEWLKLIHPMNQALPKEGRLYVRDFPDGIFACSGRHAYGSLGILHKEAANEEQKKLLSRLAKEFELVYKRFLDLQKAEAQAREAQIEASLERVRARSMAMHRSEELSEAATVLYKELLSLGVNQIFNCGYVEVDEPNRIQHGWSTDSDGEFLNGYKLPLTGDPVLQRRREAWKRRQPVFFQEVGRLALKKHIRFVSPHFGSKEVEELVRTQFPDPAFFYCGNFRNGYLSIIAHTPLTTEGVALLARFTKVFEQTYTRFLDLQKAEAQAREAQIEAALERVRARSMAMHKSDELLDAGSLLYHELLKFGIPSLTSGYVIMDADEKIGWNYIAKQIDGTVLPQPMGVYHQETDVMRAICQSWKKQEPSFIIQMNEEETIAHQTFIAERTINFNMSAEELISVTPKRLAIQTFNFKQGYLEIIGAEPLTEAQVEMLIRFARVFEMTYQRFLDLQKAEAQAREAEIQLALERVRARTGTRSVSTSDSDLIHGLLQDEFQVDGRIEGESMAAYSGLVLVGGPGALELAEHPDALRLVREANQAKKMIAAWGHSTAILARAGVVKGRRVTGDPSVADLVRGAGGRYTGKQVERHELLVTAVDDAAGFRMGREMIRIVGI